MLVCFCPYTHTHAYTNTEQYRPSLKLNDLKCVLYFLIQMNADAFWCILSLLQRHQSTDIGLMHTANSTVVQKLLCGVFVYVCKFVYECMYIVYRKRIYSFDTQIVLNVQCLYLELYLRESCNLHIRRREEGGDIIFKRPCPETSPRPLNTLEETRVFVPQQALSHCRGKVSTPTQLKSNYI